MKTGSLCSGYGGLDMAVGGALQWVCDFDKGAAKILAHRYPDVPNLHDLTLIDWTEVEPVDVITSGFPCQPFSHAGKRAGTSDDRHIWPYIADALRVLRPQYCVFENVAGHVSLGLADVLADLAALGFDAQWGTVRASDVGAPHRRERLFIVATNTAGNGWDEGRPKSTRQQRRPDVAFSSSPTPNTGSERFREHRSEPPAEETRAQPSHIASDHRSGEPAPNWGPYAAAIHQWANILGRPAPQPTTTNRTGRAVLDPRFVEWMMGLPAGWVTDVPDLSRTAQLKALGNGVVPQQAAYALQAIA
jgi:DNA (cytosine-5)-methyltransferase 1